MNEQQNTEKEQTMQSTDLKDLAAALSKAQGQMTHAEKNSENPAFDRGGKKSTYADLASVIDAARKPLSDNGLSVTQTIAPNGEKYVVVTTLLHTSGQFMKSVCPILSNKADAHGFGGGLTYARRYSYAAMVGIAQEDDDGNAASDGKPPTNNRQQSAPQQTPKTQAAAPKNHAPAGDPAIVKIKASDAKAMFAAAAKLNISTDNVRVMMQAFHDVSESKLLTVNQHAHLMDLLKTKTAEDIGRLVMEAQTEKQMQAEEAARRTEQIPT